MAPDLAIAALAPAPSRPEAGRRRPLFLTGLVPRPRLVRRLLDAAHVPVVLTVAPAGYGKTTALIEWTQSDGRELAWIALGTHHDDPVRLLTAIIHALGEIEPIGADLLAALSDADSGSSAAVVRLLGDELACRRRPFVLVLDDVHLLSAREALACLATIAERIPPGSQLVLAARAEPALPIGRMRACRQVVELGAQDLAMGHGEAAMLLRISGLQLRAADVAMLVRQTEGWPVGLSLAALSLLDQPADDGALERLVGRDRIISDYFRQEVLSQLSRERRRFLIRTSILGELCGPLCDAVLDTHESGSVLRDMARSDLLLVPLDRVDEHYRYHRLFAEMLQGELRRLEPDTEAELHRRAGAWHSERGDVERALHHALAAGDVRRAGELLWSIAPHHVFQGSDATIRHWLERFSFWQLGAHTTLALAAATTQLVAGQGAWVDHWASAAARNAQPGSESCATVLRAMLARRGIACAREGALLAYGDQPDDSPWRAVCCLLMGVASHLTGDREQAEEQLRAGMRRGAATAPGIRALCLAQLALLAFDHGDSDEGVALAARARRQADQEALSSQGTSALIFAVSALGSAQLGQVEQARLDAQTAIRLLAQLQDFAEWHEAETRITLARAFLRMGDVVSAKELLSEAARLASRDVDAVVLEVWLQDGWRQVDRFLAASVVAPTQLTTAELRVLRLLPTHMSFGEIACSHQVSVHTIKSQAQAIYRKLGVSSRSEAVQHARDVGLLD